MHNFGKIKHNIYEIAVDGITEKDSNKKALLKKFIKTIKESSILKTQARVYYNLENKVNESEYLATEYIKENISLMAKYGLADIMRENKKLEVLLEGYEVEELYDKSELHENIHNLLITKKKPTTIDNIVESTNVIKEYIVSNKHKEVVAENFLPNSVLSQFLTDKYNSKYASLSESEKNVIKSLLEENEDTQITTLENVKKDALTLVNKNISEATDVDVKDKLLNVKERILETKYSKEEFIPTITKIINLTNALSK
jgi:hypothetical protein